MNRSGLAIIAALVIAAVGAVALISGGKWFDTHVAGPLPVAVETTTTPPASTPAAPAGAKPAATTAPTQVASLQPAPSTPTATPTATRTATPTATPTSTPTATAAAPVASAAQPPANAYPEQAALPDWWGALHSADAARGATLMQAGWGDGKVQPCSSCHGVAGQPVAGSHIPRLSGQSAAYLTKQLTDYASGARQNVMMTQYARLLTPQQRADVALAWSQRDADYAAPQADPAQAGAIERGRQLAEVGDDSLMLPACSNCHGALGRGEGSLIPYIAGQHRDYGVSALQDWVEGRRANDPGGVMKAIVAKLSADDRRAVAQYYATLSPPPARIRSAAK